MSDQDTLSQKGSTWLYYPGVDIYGFSQRRSPHHLSAAEIRTLMTSGFSKINPQMLSQLVALEGQLCDVYSLQQGNSTTYLARKTDIDYVTRVPVALMYRAADFVDRAAIDGAASSHDPVVLAIAQDLPPPALGECALLWDGTEWRLREIGHLNRDAKMVQSQIADLITRMAAPAAHWMTSMQEDEFDSDLSVEGDGGLPNVAVEINHHHMGTLDEMRRRHQAEPEQYQQDWQILCALARQLAAMYWTMNAELQRDAVVKTGSATVSLPADYLTQTLMRSLVSRDEFLPNAEQTVVSWQHPLGEQRVAITLERNDGETWQHMMSLLDTLGDEAVDTFCSLLAIAIATNGSAALSTPFYLSPDDILAFCERKTSNRSYTLEQRAAIIGILNTLARIQVSATIPGKRKGRFLRLTSAIVDLMSSTIGEYNLESGEILWQKRMVALGDWARVAPQLSNHTVQLLRKILMYHPQKDRLSKRLGRFLALQFATGVEHLEMPMGTLLRQAGVAVDPINPDRSRKRIERALSTLITDQIIGSASVLVEETPDGWARHLRIEQCQRGWWQEFEAQRWLIIPAKISTDRLPPMQLPLLPD